MFKPLTVAHVFQLRSQGILSHMSERRMAKVMT
jgi:hypothetical protein